MGCSAAVGFQGKADPMEAATTLRGSLKKVYPAPTSVRESPILILYFVRSRGTRAVLRWGLSGVLSFSLWTFFVFRLMWDVRTRAAYRPELKKHTLYGLPFPGPFPSQALAVWGCSVATEGQRRCTFPAVSMAIILLPPVCMVWLHQESPTRCQRAPCNPARTP